MLTHLENFLINEVDSCPTTFNEASVTTGVEAFLNQLKADRIYIHHVNVQNKSMKNGYLVKRLVIDFSEKAE